MSGLPRRIDTVVVGAGQAGLTMSWHLRHAGRDHVLLDRRLTLGGGWQDRWDGFRLVGPNWTASFPDAPYDGDDPDGYMTRDEIVARVAAYAKTIEAPVALETEVQRVRRRADDGFDVQTNQGSIVARHVIVATGGFHVPHVPTVAAALPSRVLSIHSSDYRREPDLPPGAVLVVGSGQTGVQLVEELRSAGRDVFLSVGSAGRFPRRYRGRDSFFWLREVGWRGEVYGTALPTADKLPDPRRRLAGNLHLSGHDGGHETDLRQIGRDGVTLLGHLDAADGERIRLAPGLRANLDAADRAFDERFRQLFDSFIEAAGYDAPGAEERPRIDYDPPVIDELDLASAGISTVLWASGYRQHLGWIEPPVTDEIGFARQARGVSEVPGLFFIGSLWQRDAISATLFGVGRDAQALAVTMGLAS